MAGLGVDDHMLAPLRILSVEAALRFSGADLAASEGHGFKNALVEEGGLFVGFSDSFFLSVLFALSLLVGVRHLSFLL